MDPPRSEDELLERLRRIAGLPLGQLAAAHGVGLPGEPRRSKGWAGLLLEKALGATASSRAEPDFPGLGVELKTVPVDARGRPIESCFVASLDLAAPDLRWEASAVRSKLCRVAFVALEGDRSRPLPDRRCGPAVLWSPSPAEEAALRDDYESIVELVGEGLRVTAHTGRVLQLRPKGASAAALRNALDEEGAFVRTAPRAFYLRRTFMAALAAQHLLAPAPR